jgi:catechol 2,3-dioxygenase-like lactoylglutathione lyase family enzyme
MNLPDAPIAHEGFFATHFFTVRDQDRSKDFYVRILGGKLIKPDNPCYIKLANTWIILNSGGAPTPDKPEVRLETPSVLNRVTSFLNLRVADIWACYKQWSDNGAIFLTELLKNPDGWEWRCYMRDPDGYLIEVGQYTQIALDWFKDAVNFAARQTASSAQNRTDTIVQWFKSPPLCFANATLQAQSESEAQTARASEFETSCAI